MDENSDKNNSSDFPPISDTLREIDAEATRPLRKYERRMKELQIAENKKEATK